MTLTIMILTNLEQTKWDRATFVQGWAAVAGGAVGPCCRRRRPALCPTISLQQVQSLDKIINYWIQKRKNFLSIKTSG